MSNRIRSTSVDSEVRARRSSGVVQATVTESYDRQESWEPDGEVLDSLRFEPPSVWIVSLRSEPWVQIIAICRNRAAAHRLADGHNAGRHPDDDERWHIERHPCNVVAHVL